MLECQCIRLVEALGSLRVFFDFVFRLKSLTCPAQTLDPRHHLQPDGGGRRHMGSGTVLPRAVSTDWPSVHTSWCWCYSHTASPTHPPWLLDLGSRTQRAPERWTQDGDAAAGRSVTTRRRFLCRGCPRIPPGQHSR